MNKVLIFAPHPDDEILGCGGIMAKRIANGDEVYVCIVTKGYEPLFSAERINRNEADAKSCHTYLGVKETIFLGFPAAALETADRFELNGKIQDVVKRIQPDEVYIPHNGDMQKDHKIVNEACMVALRPKYFPQVKRVLSYEVLSETGWDMPNVQNAFIPNVFEDITDFMDKKVKALEYFSLQVSDFPDPRSGEAVIALAKYRGATIFTKAAEAFQLVREIRN